MKAPPSEVLRQQAQEQLRKLVGGPVSAIDTPSLVLNMDVLTRNLHRMAAFARKHEVRWRAHAKTHKSSALARLQLQAGAVGVCVQKTSEAEAMVAGGVHDVYISNEVIAPAKLARVAALAHRVAAEGGQMAIAVDSVVGIDRLAKAMNEARAGGGGSAVIDVFVEVDVGHGRCGVAPGRQAVTLVHEIRKHAPLRFAGLQAYHGKAQHVRSAQERRGLIGQVVQDVLFTRKLIEADGIPVPLVTGAGTGSMVGEAASGVFGELQSGSFLFMDADYAHNERDPAQPDFEHALFVKSQVMSVGVDHAVCDAGHKSHAIDSGMPMVHPLDENQGPLSYGNGGDEHGIQRAAEGSNWLPAIGSTVWLIPGHCDPTVNLHDNIIAVKGGLRQGRVERIIRVDARGALT
jgi:D-serine deaminase-like pyridoxal phosphate-dependent protein